MTTELAIPSHTGAVAPGSGFILPAVIADQGECQADTHRSRSLPTT